MRLRSCAAIPVLLLISGMSQAVAQGASSAAAGKGDVQAPDLALEVVSRANELLSAKRPAEALALLDPAIAEQDRAHADEKRRLYSAQSATQSLTYALQGAVQKMDTVVLGPGWSSLLYLKGYALIDLGRSDEAKPYLERAIALSPMNAHFLSELGEWYNAHKDWAHGYEYFERAYGAADLAPDGTIIAEKGRARRGMAFALVEQGKLKEAEKAYLECLKLDPRDSIAKAELAYVRGLRAKASD